MKKALIFCVLICLSIGMLQVPGYAANNTVFIELGSKWSYYITTESGYHTIDSNWMKTSHNVNWSVGSAPFGDRVYPEQAEKYGWVGEHHALFVRQYFYVKSTADYKNMRFYLQTFYDNTVHVYLNGTEIFANDKNGNGDWVDEYVTIELDNVSNLLKTGKNLLAVSILDNSGGREFDLSFLAAAQSISGGTVTPPDQPDDSDDSADFGSKLPFASTTDSPVSSVVTVYVTAEPVKAPPAPSVSYAVPIATVGGALCISAVMIGVALWISRKRNQSGGAK